MQVRKANRVVLAAAAAVVVSGLTSSALAQTVQSSNRFFAVSNTDKTVRVYSASSTSFGSFQYAMPVTTTPAEAGTLQGITWDHETTSALYVLDNNRIRVMWDNGTASPLRGPVWNMPQVTNTAIDIAYRSGELFVTDRTNKIYVYSSTTGAHLRTMAVTNSPSGGQGAPSALEGIEIPWNYDSTYLVAGDRNRAAGGYLINASSGTATTGYFWGDTGGLNPVYQMSPGLWHSASASTSSTHWWYNNNLTTNCTTGGYNTWASETVKDQTYTNSNGYWIMSRDTGVDFWNSSSWNPSRTDSVAVNDARGIFFKYNSNPGSPNPYAIDGLVGGLNDMTIGGSTTSGVPAGVQLLSTANNANIAVSGADTIITRLNSSSAPTRLIGGSGDSNAGNGDITVAGAIDYDGLSAAKTLSLTSARNVTIGAAISDSVPASAVNLSMILSARTPGLITGTLPTTGGLSVNANMLLTGGVLTTSSNAGATAIATNINITANGGITMSGATIAHAGGTGVMTANAASTGNMTFNSTAAGGIQIGAALVAGGTGAGNITFNATNGGTVAAAAVTASGAFTVNTTANATYNGAIAVGTFAANNGTHSGLGTIAATTMTLGNSTTSFSASNAVTVTTMNLNQGSFTKTGASTLAVTTLNGADGAVTTSSTTNIGSMNLGGSGVFNVLGGTTNFATSMGTTGTINVLPGATLDINYAIPVNTPTININGGTLDLLVTPATGGSSYNFNGGTVVIPGNQAYASGNGMARFMGSSLAAGRTVQVGGTLTFATGYTLSGGTLSVGNFANGFNLVFNSGTLAFTVTDLAVTAAGQFGDSVSLGSGKTVSTSGTSDIIVGTDGVIELSGGRLVNSSTFTNNGEIRFASSGSRIQGSGTLTNNGLISGTGRVDIAEMINMSGGRIRALAAQSLRFTTPIENAGRIELQGGSLETTALNNGTDAVMTMSNNATLRTSPDIASNNTGSMFISGSADIYGDLANGSGGIVRIAGGGVVNFFDDIDNSAGTEFQVGGGSAAIFFDSLAPGSIFGDGTVVIVGSLAPRIGHSNIGTDLTLDDASTTTMSIGTASEYSSINVDGEAQLGGTLVVTETGNRYLGAEYLLFTAANMVGGFDDIVLPQPAFGMNYELQITGNSVSAVVVPEPATLSALAGLAALGLRRRRR